MPEVRLSNDAVDDLPAYELESKRCDPTPKPKSFQQPQLVARISFCESSRSIKPRFNRSDDQQVERPGSAGTGSFASIREN